MPITVRADCTSCENACCRAVWMLSTSFVTRDMSVAALTGVEVAERQAVELDLDVLAERKTTRMTSPLRMYPCAQLRIEATMYMSSTMMIRRPSSMKSMP